MVSLSRLFIDKVALTIPLQSRTLQSAVIDHLQTYADDGLIHPTFFGDLVSRYHLAYTVPLAGEHRATIQAAPRDDRMNFLRLEFNPNHRGRAQESTFEALANVVRPAWPNFISALDRARISRLDFAVDIRGVHVDMLGIHHNTRSPYSTKFGRDGKTTGYYLGKRTSNRYWVMYDKKREARERHHRILRSEQTRVEFRCADLGAMSTLQDMANPFSLISLTMYPQHDDAQHYYAHFLDSCRRRGVQAALYLVQDRRKRAQYRAWLSASCSPPWWNPDAIWAQRMAALDRAFGG